MRTGKMATILLAVALLIGLSQPAHAYLDANSGSMLMQTLLGGIAGASVLVRLSWHQVMVRFGIRKNFD